MPAAHPTQPLNPVPRIDQLEPFHVATRLTGIPPTCAVTPPTKVTSPATAMSPPGPGVSRVAIVC